MRLPAIIALLVLAACAPMEPSGKPLIVVTFFPLYDVAQEIAGPGYEVITLIPAGVEPHDYDMQPSDLRKVDKAVLFIGMGLEWSSLEERAISVNPAITFMDASEGIDLVSISDATIDPHIWLSPKRMKKITANVGEGLSAVDPSATTRMNSVLSKLDALDNEYSEGLSGCSKDTIIVSHLAFGYPAKDYGFEQIGISGLKPESEPSPGAMRELIDTVRGRGIKYVLYEELVDPRVSRVIADEAGAEPLVISHVNSAKDKDYYGQMRDNLATLRIALECD